VRVSKNGAVAMWGRGFACYAGILSAAQFAGL